MLSDSFGASAIWDTVLTATQLYCDKKTFQDLILPARLEEYNSRDESVVVKIPQGVSKETFQDRALAPLRKAFANAIGLSPHIYLEENYAFKTPSFDNQPQANTAKHTKSGEGDESDTEEGKSASLTQQDQGERPANGFSNSRSNAAKCIALNPAYSFENFVVGPSNRLAAAAAKAVSENPGKAYNPLFIHGGVGLGKTHLLQAISQVLIKQDPTLRIHYVSCEQFVNDFIEALGAGMQSSFRRAFRDIDLLVIDDIHFLANKEATQEEFFHTFNDLYNAGKQIIISSDCPPKEIPDLEERLTSRFLSGLPVKIEAPGAEMRESIVRAKAHRRDIQLPPEVAEFIAEKVTSNVRELEGAIVQVAAAAHMLGVPITRQVAQEALRDLCSLRYNQRISVDMIVELVCDHFHVKLSELQSARRAKSLVYPRQLAMYLVKDLTEKTLNEIGGFFGGRDHTTVLHSIRKIQKALDTNDETRSFLEMAKMRLLDQRA